MHERCELWETNREQTNRQIKKNRKRNSTNNIAHGYICTHVHMYVQKNKWYAEPEPEDEYVAVMK